MKLSTFYKVPVILVISLLFVSFLPTRLEAQAWYNTGWLYRKAITIDYTKVGAGPHTNFPVLISHTDAALITKAQADGDDILFTSADGTTKLDHEIENYTSASGAIVSWVEIPSLSSAANTVIYMYYGNAAATSQQNVTGTWDGSFNGVYHLNNAFADATANARNGTNTGTTNVTGKISQGRGFVPGDGADKIDITGLMGSPASITLSGWFYRNATATESSSIIGLGDHAFLQVLNNATGAQGGYYDGTTWLETPTNTTYNNAWRYAVWTFATGPNAQKIYIDGVLIATTANIGTISYAGLGANTKIGGHGNGNTNQDMDGSIDEVRVAATPRSAGWILSEFNNQNSPGTFYSVGTETPTKTFTGTGNFSDATKWTGGTLPALYEHLVIDGACTVDNSVATDNIAYGTLTIGTATGRTLNWIAGGTNRLNVSNVSAGAGASALNMANGGSLMIRGNWTSTNLTFTPGAGTIEVQSGITLPVAYANYNNLTVNGTGATVSLGAATTLTGNLVITAGTFNANNFNATIGANLVNNGTFTAGSGNITFNNTGTHTITGSSTTAFNTITVDKGTNFTTNILDVQSVITMATGGLTITNGTFKLSGASTIAPFNGAYTIPATSGLWVNGGTVSSLNNISLLGMLRVSAGILNIGDALEERLFAGNGSTIIVEGGALNIAGRFTRVLPGNVISFTMSGGTFTVPTIGTTAAAISPFTFDEPASSFTMSGGTIIIAKSGNANTGYTNLAATNNVTGGTIQIGDASTAAASTIQVNSTAPIWNLTVNATNAPVAEINTNALTVKNDVTISGGTLNANSLDLTVGRNWINNGTFTSGAATVIFNGTTVMSGTNVTNTFNNFTVSASSTVTSSTGLTGLVVNGTLTTGASSILDLGTTTILSGTLGSISNSGTIKTSVLTTTSTVPVPISKTWGGTVDYGNTTGAQTAVAGTYNNLTVRAGAGVTATAGGNLVVDATLSVTTANGNLALSTYVLSGTLSGIAITGNLKTSSTSATPIPSGKTWGGTIYYDALAGAQTVIGGTYNIIRFSNTSGINTAAGDLTVNNQFLTATGGILDMGSTYRIINMGAGITNNGTVKTSVVTTTSALPFPVNRTWGGTGTVEYAATTGAQTVMIGTYNNLKMSNTSGTNTITGNVTLDGVFTLTGGTVTTNSYLISLNSTASVSRTGGHIIGNFKKHVATGATSRTFEVGDATNYTPVTVAFASVTTANYLTVSVLASDHPNLGIAGIKTDKSANRYWSFINQGIVFTTYNSTFTFVPADLDAGANTTNFIAGNYNAGWTYPTVGTKTSTTTEATGLTTFGDYQIGEPNATKTFTGIGNFSDAVRWTGGSVPVAGEHLVIDGTCTVDNAAGTNNIAYGTLTIGTATGRTLNWAAGGTNRLNVSNVSNGAGLSTLDMTGGGTLVIRGTLLPTSLIFIPGTGTVEIQYSLTLPAVPAFNNLTINASGITVGLSAALNITGNLRIAAGTFNPNNFNITVGGNWVNDASATSFTAGTSTVTFNGTAIRYISGTFPTTFSGFTMDRTTAVTLYSNVTITGPLTLTNGNINTGSSTLYLNATGTLARTSGHVVGNFKKYIATGATSKTFEIGDAGNYTPLTIAFASVGTAGDLTSRVLKFDHPQLAGSGITADKSVNRYWNFTNTGIAFTTATITMNWVAGDVDAGSTTANFKVAKYNNPTWSLPAIASPLATSIQATGITSFGDYAVGELCLATAPIVTTPVNYCQNATATPLTATGTALIWGTAVPVAGSVGGTTTFTHTTYVDDIYTANNHKTHFTITTPYTTITTVDYHIPLYQTVTGLVLAIFNSSGTVIAISSTTTTYTANAGLTTITNTFNYPIQAAGDYSIGIYSGAGIMGDDSPTFPITEATGTINVTGVSVAGSRCFNNIQFTGNAASVAPTPSTTGLGTTNYTVYQNAGGCISSNATIAVIVSAPPTPAAAGVDQAGAATCGLITVTLAANTPVTGTGAWSIISGTGGTVTTPSSPASTFTGTAGTTYTLRWTISSGSCTASADDVVVSFNRNPTTSAAGADQTGAATCGSSLVTLGANAPAIGTGAWSIISGTGGTITTPAGANSTFSGTAGNSYTLRWTISNSPCTASTDDVIISLSQVVNYGISYTNGASGVLCATNGEGGSVTLTAPAGSVFGTVGFASYGTPNGSCPTFTIGTCHQTTSQATVEGYLLGNNTATIPATNGVFTDPCTGVTKRLYVQATYTQPVCSGTSPGTITGSVPTGGNGTYAYSWEISTTSSTAGFATITGITTPSYTPAGVLTQTTWYKRSVLSGACTVSAILRVSVVNPGSWTGALNTAWNNSGNWLCGAIPGTTTNVTIPASLTNYPLLNTGAFSVQNIVIQNAASLTVTGATLRIAGTISNAGTLFNVSGGIIEMNGTGAQTIPAATFSGNLLKSLLINNAAGVTLGGALNLTDTLKVSAGNLASNGYLTLISTGSGTARVAPLPVDGSGIATSNITGNVIVERYIPNKRAWRLLTAPLSTTGPIYNSWQNGGVDEAGKGMLVTGPNPLPANGLDASAFNAVSMKSFNSVTQAFVNITDTKNTNLSTTAASAANVGYFVFVRGDRNSNNLYAANSSATTLKSTGILQAGKQTFTAPAPLNSYSMMVNPYASPVDFNTVQRSHVARLFYTWDAKLNLLGGYATLIFNGDGSYTKSPPSSLQDNNIQSGQAFFVLTDTALAASLSFYESSKSYLNHNAAFRPLNQVKSMEITLNLLETDNSTIAADGVVAEFGDGYNPGVDNQDAIKFTNINETFSLLRNGVSLAIERRPSIVTIDTLFLKLTQSSQRNYQLVFNPNNLSQPTRLAFLEDSYTGISTLVDLQGGTNFNFTINSDAASMNATRFRLVFKQSGALPVSFNDVNAWQQGENIAVSWKVENQLNVDRYELEKSLDGNNFNKVNTQPVANPNSTNAIYNWLDLHAANGDNFYRIRNVDRDGTAAYSKIAKVNIGKVAGLMEVYPNPVKDGVIGLQFNNMARGKYTIRLVNPIGQLIMVKTIQHAGGSAMEKMLLSRLIAKGMYSLEVTNPDNSKTAIKLRND